MVALKEMGIGGGGRVGNRLKRRFYSAKKGEISCL